jgi:Dolichyl-phosphate-mannose-protein mannosyltransferase
VSALPDARAPADDARAGRGYEARTIALLSCLSLLVFVTYYVVFKKNRPTLWNDTYEYAQVARNVAVGKGLKTDAVTVLEAWFLGDSGLPPPYFLHDPGNSLLMGGFFRLFGPRNSVIGWTGGVFFVLLAPFTFALGRKLFDGPVAVLAGLLVAVNTPLLLFAAAGYGEVPGAFVLTLLLFLLVDTRSPRRLLLAGFVFGWLVLLRANSLPLLPWLLLFVFASERARAAAPVPWRWRVRPWLAFLAGLAAVLGPNALRNYRWTGSPFYMVSSFYTLVYHTAAVRKATWVFSQPGLDVNPGDYVLAHPGELLAKMAWQLSRETLHLLEGGLGWQRDFASSLYVFLFVLALVAPPSDEGAGRRRVRWLLAASVATTLVVGSAFHLRWRHLYAFLPLVILFAADALVRMLGPQRAARPSVLAATVLLVAAYGATPVVQSVRVEAGLLAERNRFYRQLATFLQDTTPPDAVLLLDVSGGRFNPLGNAMAWYAERTVVQYAGATASSPLVLQASRPIFGVRVRLEARDPSFHDVVPEDERLNHAPGFSPVAEWSGTLGDATLFRRLPPRPHETSPP